MYCNFKYIVFEILKLQNLKIPNPRYTLKPSHANNLSYSAIAFVILSCKKFAWVLHVACQHLYLQSWIQHYAFLHYMCNLGTGIIIMHYQLNYKKLLKQKVHGNQQQLTGKKTVAGPLFFQMQDAHTKQESMPFLTASRTGGAVLKPAECLAENLHPNSQQAENNGTKTIKSLHCDPSTLPGVKKTRVQT